jgi:hypothetical protein
MAGGGQARLGRQRDIMPAVSVPRVVSTLLPLSVRLVPA